MYSSSATTVKTSYGRRYDIDFVAGNYYDDFSDSTPESSPPLNGKQDPHKEGDGLMNTPVDPLATEPTDALLLGEGALEDRPSHREFKTFLQAPYQGSGFSMTRTPSIPIAIQSRDQSRSRSHLQVDMMDATPTPAYLGPATLKTKKKRKKKTMEKKDTEKRQTAKALSSLRGFPQTSTMSGDESDLSTHQFPKRDISINTSLANSPFLRPLSRTSSITTGISALRQQIDSLALARESSDTGSARSQAESVPTSSGISNSDCQSPREIQALQTERYEVPLDEDFVSNEVERDQIFDPLSPLFSPLDSVHRRMSAQDFEPLTCLGTGSFGTVYLVKQKSSGRLFAQKMFRKASLTITRSLIEQTKTERSILETINRHPFIVNLYYAFQDQEKLYLILEYAQGGELFHHLAAESMFPEDTAAFYLAEMAIALNYLHETGIVYRDLKPENCLLDSDGHLLLTDFGLSKEVAAEEAGKCNSILGTWDYMAPEVIEGKPYDKAVDWWSLGAVACDLLTGAPPFTANNRAKTIERILKCKPKFPYYMSTDAKDLLTRLLRRDPRKRLGSNMPKDLQTFKAHRFFRKLDWKKLESRELEPPIKPVITDPELAENFSPEFTQMALSPRSARTMVAPWDDEALESNPFGGFSYVASRSLFRNEGFLTTAMQMEEEEIGRMEQ